MAESTIISIPAKQWEVYSTDLTVAVGCPRCGLPIFMHVNKPAPEVQQYFQDKIYWNFVKNNCSRCGEEIVVKYDENPEQPPAEEPKAEEAKE